VYEQDEVDLMTRAREFVGRFGRQDQDGIVDENGFRHFEAPQRAEHDDSEAGRLRDGFRRRVPPDLSTWWSDLARQVGKDVGVVVLEE
jgi:hypothetical protein